MSNSLFWIPVVP